MSSASLQTNWPVDRDAVDRAVALVAEESFFAVIDPPPHEATAGGRLLQARVAFEGGFSGVLSCTMPRALAHELTAAFSGSSPDEIAVADPAVDDLAGEFANMVCGRWLSAVAPTHLFSLAHPAVEPVAAPGSGALIGLVNGQPVWIELTVER